MKLKKFILICLCYFPLFTFASTTQTIQLSKYYQASCTSYTGTWRGFFTDPTDLFGNGGPWPVEISLYNSGTNIVGKVSDDKAPSYVSKSMQGTLWAQCHHGQLSNIFLGNEKQCGSFSQTGLLVSKNVLILQIKYENAMNGAPFLLVLKRINNHYAGDIPQNMQMDSVQSCH